jgi:hypothetical protein
MPLPCGSAVHHNVTLRHLDCSPLLFRPPPERDLDHSCARDPPAPAGPDHSSPQPPPAPSLSGGLDEADLFFEDPEGFLRCVLTGAGRPAGGPAGGRDGQAYSHVIFFDVLEPVVGPVLRAAGFAPAESMFHAHVRLESRIGHRISVWTAAAAMGAGAAAGGAARPAAPPGASAAGREL